MKYGANDIWGAILRGFILLWLGLVCIEVVSVASDYHLTQQEPVINPVCRGEFGHRRPCPKEAHEWRR